jgi:uncharacterized protein YhfF
MQMTDEKRISQYWHDFLQKTNRDADLMYYECFHFCHTEVLANSLLQLVLDGTTSSSLLSYQARNEPLPRVGSLSIVTDFAGNPRCVIETKSVMILPFKDMTYDICKREGEDDTLESWQEGHIRFFTIDAAENNFVFTWDMPIVFEDFEVVYR